MADNHHEHGTMDVTEQEKTFAGFMRWTVWILAIVFVILIFMAITQT